MSREMCSLFWKKYTGFTLRTSTVTSDIIVRTARTAVGKVKQIFIGRTGSIYVGQLVRATLHYTYA